VTRDMSSSRRGAITGGDQITAVLRAHTQSMFPPWGFCLTPIPSCCSRGVRIPPHSGRVDSCVRSVCLTRSGSVNPGVPSNPHYSCGQQPASSSTRTIPTLQLWSRLAPPALALQLLPTTMMGRRGAEQGQPRARDRARAFSQHGRGSRHRRRSVALDPGPCASLDDRPWPRPSGARGDAPNHPTCPGCDGPLLWRAQPTEISKSRPDPS
jgi:hypothetical protein